MKKTIIIVLCCLFLLGGCTYADSDNGIYGFTQRLNTLCPEYGIDITGYINDTENNTFTRFFEFGDATVMLSFHYTDTGRLERGDIAFDGECKKQDEAVDFIMNIITAYFDIEDCKTEILNQLNLPDAFFKETLKTKSAESGKCRLLLDVTAVGTVVTVYKDID